MKWQNLVWTDMWFLGLTLMLADNTGKLIYLMGHIIIKTPMNYWIFSSICLNNSSRIKLYIFWNPNMPDEMQWKITVRSMHKYSPVTLHLTDFSRVSLVCAVDKLLQLPSTSLEGTLSIVCILYLFFRNNRKQRQNWSRGYSWKYV